MVTPTHLFMISIIMTAFIGICYVNSYDVSLTRLQTLETNVDYLEFNMSLNKFSRTQAGITLYFTLFKDLPNDTYISIQLYGEYSNEYRRLPVRVGRIICESLKTEFHWVKEEILKDGVFPTKCPVKKGFYYTRNFVPNAANFPASLPWTNLKVKMNITLPGGIILARTEVYFKLDQDANLKRQFQTHHLLNN